MVFYDYKTAQDGTSIILHSVEKDISVILSVEGNGISFISCSLLISLLILFGLCVCVCVNQDIVSFHILAHAYLNP